MIEVFVLINGEPMAQVEIKNVGCGKCPHPMIAGCEHIEYADYTVKFGVDRGSAVGIHSRTLYGFPRKYYNALALLKQALNTLDEKELKLEPGYDPDSPEATISSDLARRLRGTVREIQAGFSRLHRD